MRTIILLVAMALLAGCGPVYRHNDRQALMEARDEYTACLRSASTAESCERQRLIFNTELERQGMRPISRLEVEADIKSR